MDDPRGISRRDLLRGRLRGEAPRDASSGSAPGSARGPAPESGRAPSSRRVAVLPFHRPPGAIDEASFLEACTRCGECATACPVGAIIPVSDRFPAAEGTPTIDAHASACVMCADTPCITACEPGVLRADQPLRMGVALIQPMDCIAWNGTLCSVCRERCPVPGAIEVNGGRPVIRAETCTGCGVCHHVCPAPVNAVILMPLADRPQAAPLPRTDPDSPRSDP